MRPTPPRLLAVPLAVLLAGAWSPAASVPENRQLASTDYTDSQPFDTEILRVGGTGRFTLDFNPDPQVNLTAGLWVGAEIDRGKGTEQITSVAAYSYEFWPVAQPNSHPLLQLLQVDTDTSITMHEPLGLRVAQNVWSSTAVGFDAFVITSYRITNISGEWSPPGWDMEHVYVAIFMDPDVGQGGGDTWSDDQVGYTVTAAGRPMAYAYDNPGTGGDDTLQRVGIVLLDHPMHAFRRWSVAGDTESDAGQYDQIRGASYETRTIEPNTTTPADYRMILSAGPFTLPIGASQTVTFALGIGDALGTAAHRAQEFAVAPELRVTEAAPATFRFAGLPQGAHLFIHDVAGRRVAALQGSADGAAVWDAAGRGVGSGVYFYRTDTPAGSARGKIVVAR